MITKVRLVYVTFGAFLSALALTLPRALFSLIFIVAFAIFIEPKLPVGAKGPKDNRFDQIALLIGGLIVIAIAFLIHKIR